MRSSPDTRPPMPRSLTVALAVLAACLAALGYYCFRLGSGSRGAIEPPPGAPQRIVSLAPDLTEILVTLGATDRIVGVTDFCLGSIPEVKGKASVGRFLDRNVET